jgi:hypothetical protein
MNAESPNIRVSPVSTLVFDRGLNRPFSPTQSIYSGLAERGRPEGDSFAHGLDLWISILTTFRIGEVSTQNTGASRCRNRRRL